MTSTGASPGPGEPRARLDLALAVRGLAAYQVLVWHTAGFAWHDGAAAWLNVSGTQCVWLFFVISGYFVSSGFITGRYRVERPSELAAFTVARALRILPVYVVAAVVTALILSAGSFGLHDPQAIHKLASTLLFLSPSATLPTPLWAIVIEMYFYISIPFVFLAFRRFRAGFRVRLVIYAALVAVPVARLLAGDALDDRTFIGNASHFLAGFMAHDIWAIVARHRLLDRRGAMQVLLGIIVIALIVPTAIYHAQRAVFWSAGSLLTDIAVVGIILAHKRLEERNTRAGTPMVALQSFGAIALGVYVWHSVVVTVMPAVRGSVLTVSALGVALAVVSYFVIERPALRLRDRLTQRSFLGLARRAAG